MKTNMFDTKTRGYRFNNSADATLFKARLLRACYSGAVIRKGLPEYRGQVETGYTVWIKARTIADELSISQLYRGR